MSVGNFYRNKFFNSDDQKFVAKTSLFKRATNKMIASVTAFATAFVPIAFSFPTQQAHAQQIIIDPAAPSTQLFKSGNGTPQINIATPKSGVSVNKFSNFNVGSDGLILNNSRTGGLSQTGGQVNANQNLVGGEANVILNEVTSSSPSTLTGTTEVFGGRAAVIIANPNGLGCNGCKFINTSRTTLTTGKPNVNGSNINLDVSRGTINIGSGGFESEGSADLIGRHVLVNGQVKADDKLIVSGGSQRFNHNNSTVQAAPILSTRKSLFAVDASEFGALNAGQIQIHGNESGLGVNAYGDINSTGNVRLSSKGNLFYGNINSGGSASVAASGGVRQYGNAKLQGDFNVTGQNFTLYSDRVLETEGDVTINAKDFVVVVGEVLADDITIETDTSVTNNGFLLAGSGLKIIAGENITNQREIATEYDVYYDPTIKQYLDAYQAQLFSGDTDQKAFAQKMLQRAATHEIIQEYVKAGATLLGRNISLEANLDIDLTQDNGEEGNIKNIGGAIIATNNIDLRAGESITNQFIALKEKLDASDGCKGSNCGHKTNFHAGEILAGGDITLRAGLNVENRASNIAAAGSITAVAGADIVNSLKASSYALKNNDTVTVAARGVYSYRSCRGRWFWRRCSTRYVPYTYNRSALRTITDEESVLAPSRIVTLNDNINLYAGRDIVSIGSEISSGQDLILNAQEATYLTSYTGSNRRFTTVDGRVSSYATDLVTAPTVLQGRNIVVNSGDDIISTGTRVLASNDLAIRSENGAIKIDSADLLNNGTGVDLLAEDLVNVEGDIAGKILNDPSLAKDFGEYLKSEQAELLLSVAALAQTDDPKSLRDVVKNVGLQSGRSLFEIDREKLQKDLEAAFDKVETQSGEKFTDLDDRVEAYLDEFNEELAAIRARENLSSEELERVTAERLSPAKTQYENESAYNQRIHDQRVAYYKRYYGRYMNIYAHYRNVYARYANIYARYARYSWIYRYYSNIFRYYSNVYGNYYNRFAGYLRNAQAREARSLQVRQQAAQARYAIAEANIREQVQKEFGNGGNKEQQIAELKAKMEQQMVSFEGERTGLFDDLNKETENVIRIAERVNQFKAQLDQLSTKAIAKGSAQVGHDSAAAALVAKTFSQIPNLAEVSVDANGVLQNKITTPTEFTREVTKTRDVYQTRSYTSYVRRSGYRSQPYWSRCGEAGYRCLQYRYTRYSYYSPVTRTQRVKVGTETYQDTETYLKDIITNETLLTDDRAKQEELIDSLAWRFDTYRTLQDTQNKQGNLIVARNDVSLASNDDLTFGGNVKSGEDLTLISQSGSVNLSSDINTKGDVNVVAGLDIANSNSIAASDINFSAGRNFSSNRTRLTANNINVDSHNAYFDNVAAINANSSARFNADGNLRISGGSVQAGTLEFASRGNIHFNSSISQLAQSDLDITAAQSFTNTGKLSAYNLAVTSANGSISNTGTITTSNDLSLIASAGALSNTGSVSASGDANLAGNGGSLTNTGTIRSSDDLRLSAANDISNTGRNISAGGTLTAFAGRDIVNQARRNNFRLTSAHGCLGAACGRTGYSYTEATISAGEGAILNAGRDVLNRGSSISGNDFVNVTAGRDVRNEGLYGKYTHKDYLRTWSKRKWYGKRTNYVVRHFDQRAVLQTAAITSQNGSTTLDAGRNITNVGALVQAKDNAVLKAAENVIMRSVSVELASENYYKQSSSWLGFIKLGSTTSSAQWNQFAKIRSVVDGDNVSIQAGRNIYAKGASLVAANDVDVLAGGNVIIEPNRERRYNRIDNKSSGLFGWFRNDYKHVRESQTIDPSRLNARNDLALVSANGDINISGSRLTAGRDIELSAINGAINFGAEITSDYEQTETYSDNGLWWKSRDQGHYREDVVHNAISAGGTIKFRAANGITIEYKDNGSLEDALSTFSQSPDLKWMAALQGDNRVQWNAVIAQSQEWDYEAEGLTAPAAALIAIALTAATGGSPLGTLVANAPLNAALNAGMQALINRSAISLINNKGDLGATLKELGSEESLRSLAVAMISAGVTTHLDATLFKDVVAAGSKGAGFDPNLLGQQLVRDVTYSAVRAGISTGIQGGDFGDEFVSNLRLAAASTLGAQLRQEIGIKARSGDLNETTKLIAHAVVGCAIGALASDNCGSGALGSVVGEFVGDRLLADERANELSEELNEAISNKEITREQAEILANEWQQRGVDISQLAAGLAAAIVGGDVNTAADAANSVVTNNALCAGFCIAGALVVIAALLETADKVLIAKDAYDLTQLTLECRAGSDAACQQARQTAIETGIVTAAEVTIGNAIPGSAIATKILIGIRKNVDPKTLERVDNIVENATNRNVNVADARPGTPEYDLLNTPPANTRVSLDNGTTFKTNSGGYVEEITYQPVNTSGIRDSRQTAVGREGISGDVGGHIQACRHGGTCDRFNLFPQNSNFNNSSYRRWENEITRSLQNGDNVGNVTVRFGRSNPNSARPDNLEIEYQINGVNRRLEFENQVGG